VDEVKEKEGIEREKENTKKQKEGTGCDNLVSIEFLIWLS